MDRIALIADIHGNAIALRHVLAEIDRQGIEQIICLGDVAATGPQPDEAVTELRLRNIPTIMGNADTEILDPADPDQADEPMKKILQISVWGNEKLAAVNHGFLSNLPGHIEVETGIGSLLCVHGSPESFNETIYADTPHTDLDRMLDGCSSTMIAAGHTHIQMLRRHRNQTVLNPGAVGLAYSPVMPADDVRAVPRAEFAVLEIGGGRITYRFEYLPYDVAPLLMAAQDSGMPHAEWWIGLWQDS